jgi:ElaB/YqjD/DUF883 family membrane-anchored ribosome-binding protein
MPDRKQNPGYDVISKDPAAIAQSLGEHREEMGDSMEELNEDVRGKMASAKRAVMFVPNKIKAAGSAGRRASGKVVAYAKDNPVKAAAIGAATVGLISAGVMVARRRRARNAAQATAAKSTSAGKGKKAKGSARSGKRRSSR